MKTSGDVWEYLKEPDRAGGNLEIAYPAQRPQLLLVTEFGLAFQFLVFDRRGVRVAEGAAFEMRSAGNRRGGSNPSLSDDF